METTAAVQTLTDELLGEIERTCVMRDISDIERVITELRTLRAENAELRKDAERYRWLRDDALNLEVTAPAIMVVDKEGQPAYLVDTLKGLLCDNYADAAIDTAMEQAK